MTEKASSDGHSPAEPQIAKPSAGRSSLMRMFRLCRKELREIVRDRRTIVTLILMPLLAYPLLSMSFQRLVLSSSSSMGSLRCIAGVPNEETSRDLAALMSMGQRFLSRDGRSENPANPATSDEPEVSVLVTEDLEAALDEGIIDLGVRIRSLGSEPVIPFVGPPRDVQLTLREGSALSKAGADFIQQRTIALNEFYFERRLERAGLQPRLPMRVRTETISGSGAAVSLTAFVPLILILMTITGAVYPAIDLTAGERERGTLETLMAAPVPRFGLLFAKYVAVVTIAMLTATTNLIAMTVTLIATGMGPLVFGDGGPTIKLIDQVFMLLLLFAAFFSAILLAITSFARSFKEAQSYLIPVMLLTLAPGIMSLMPNLEFTATLAVTPLVNIVLLARDLLEGSVDPRLATAAVLSTLFYAVGAIGLAARIFGTDAILYGSQASWTDLARRPDQMREHATVSGAMICLACIYPCYFLLANSLQRLSGTSMPARLLLAALVTLSLFVGLPIVAAVLQRIRFVTGFQLRVPGVVACLGAAILGLSLWPFAHEVFMLNEFVGIKSLDVDQIESAQALLESFRNISPVVILVSFALAPAVCEEFFFRGYLMGALRQAMPGYASVLISSVLFGVFHVITTSVMATERLLPSTFLGIVLGWICLRTGSVIPGMLLHALHNGLLLMMGKYREELASWGWGVEEQSHMPATWLGSALIAVVLGLVMVWATTRRSDRSP